MSPFVLSGKLYAKIFPLKEQYDLFFFCPSYSIGGGERVQGDIIDAVKDKKIMVFFTKVSHNKGSYHLHDKPNTTLMDISRYTDNRMLYFMNFFYRGVCSGYINSQKEKLVVFIAQSNFGYKVTPHIRSDIKITELIHMHTEKFLWVWAPFIKFIDRRVVLGEIIKKKFRKVYQNAGIPDKYFDNITIIPNCLNVIPHSILKREESKLLQIYYAGRGTAQKRIHIIVQIIEKCNELSLPVKFTLAGSFKDELPEKLVQNGTYIGEIKAGQDMMDFQQKMDLLIMTSAWEGFPMVIMEAMSLGVVCNVTEVDEIPSYIQHQKTGLIIKNHENEALIVDEAVTNIVWAINNRNEINIIRSNAFELAKEKFGKQLFNTRYQELLKLDL